MSSTLLETTRPEALGLHGGSPTMTEVLPARRRWGKQELAQLREMLEQPSLFYLTGPQTRLLKERFQ